ncbi:hypothetical protein ACJMK2_044467 [Sinanodonta woodiana]|uniref:CCHC-type domain-containing protein n=1 Tax=Sinanodonta woodiana TaxID=1069815 RepID=A0ABD3W1J0_SINWO
MTRFARYIGGNRKKPLEATSWKEMAQRKDSTKSTDSFKKGQAKEGIPKRHEQQFHKTDNKKIKKWKTTELNQEKEQYKKSVKSEWRRLKRQKIVEAGKVCYNCRQSGHQLSDCPEVTGDQEQGTGICFKCGSTEHISSKCSVKLPKGVYPYAKCFICGETGHITRQCPDNPRGIYPNGGCCRVCASVDHLKRDCPELQKQQGIGDMTVERISKIKSMDEEPGLLDSKPKTSKKTGPKLVKF